jgi:hypothetical protein
MADRILISLPVVGALSLTREATRLRCPDRHSCAACGGRTHRIARVREGICRHRSACQLD